jgi:hypothetical protein
MLSLTLEIVNDFLKMMMLYEAMTIRIFGIKGFWLECEDKFLM